MDKPGDRPSPHRWGKDEIPPGEIADVELVVGENSSGVSVRIQVHVRRGLADGPTLLVTAALHGDELNGTGAIRELILTEEFELQRGTLILVPVLNVLGFDSHSRYLPDGRDLNRCFPGLPKGSLASRLARRIFTQLIRRADYVIDLHTAAVQRTNFPNLRANVNDPRTRWLAESFGCGLIMDGEGPKGSLRRVASSHGHPTITFEGGEVWKVEPMIVEYILRGVRNVLSDLKMIPSVIDRPSYSTIIRETKWIRADRGGFLQFHVAPGDIVEHQQPLATNFSLLGQEHNALLAPFKGIVIGMTTLPAVSTGEAVCHLGRLPEDLAQATQLRKVTSPDELHLMTQRDLGTNLRIVEPPASNE